MVHLSSHEERFCCYVKPYEVLVTTRIPVDYG